MTFKHTPIVATLSAALSLGTPRWADASPPDGEAPPASAATKVKIALVVDTTAIDEEFRRQLELITDRQIRPALEQAGYEVADGFVDLALRVRYAPVDAGQFRDHGIHFEIIRGSEVKPAIEWALCNACGQVRLENLLTANTPQLLEALEKATTESPATQEPDEGSEDGDDGDSGDGDGDSTAPLPKPIGPIGISGAVGLGLGIGLSIGGGIVLANPTRQDLQDHELIGTEIDRTNLGIALVIPGATLVVAGTVMLAVDLAKRAKQRKSANNITVVPTLSPSSAGIGVVGRF